MNSITVNTEKGKVILNLPTSIDEINPVYLTEVTEHIKVAPEYSLVALVYSTTISQVLNMKNVPANVAVVPMLKQVKQIVSLLKELILKIFLL